MSTFLTVRCWCGKQSSLSHDYCRCIPVRWKSWYAIDNYAVGRCKRQPIRRSSLAREAIDWASPWVIVRFIGSSMNCGISWLGGSRCPWHPRIHDLRHSFAVRRLILWHEQSIDVDQAMLTLSTYLGHAKISNTYWYLTGVPELMALAGSKFECFVEAAETDDE